MAQEPLSGADNIFTMPTDVDLDYGTVVNETGEAVKLTHGSYNMFIVSPDRRVRKDAYETFYKAYRGMKKHAQRDLLHLRQGRRVSGAGAQV